MKNKSEVVIYLCGFTGRNGWNTCHWPWKRFNDVYNRLGYEVRWLEPEEFKDFEQKDAKKSRIFVTWDKPDTIALINDGIYEHGRDAIMHKMILFGGYDSGKNWGTTDEERQEFFKNFRWTQHKIFEDAYDAGANVWGFGAKTIHKGLGEKERIVEKLKDRIFGIPWGSSLYSWDEIQSAVPVMDNLQADCAWVGSIWGKPGRGNIDSWHQYLGNMANDKQLTWNAAGEGTQAGIVDNETHKAILRTGKICPIVNAPPWRIEKGVMDRFWTVFTTGRFGVVDTEGVYLFFDKDEVVCTEDPGEYEELSRYYIKNIDKQKPYIEKIQKRIKQEYNWYTSWDNILKKVTSEL